MRFALCALLALSCRPAKPKAAEPVFAPTLFARVLVVVDGDTIVIEGGDRVKLIGVDAPEIRKLVEGKYQGDDQPWGPDAARHLSRLLLHRKVGLQFDAGRTDTAGRTPAYVMLDGALVNARLLEEGYGRYDVGGTVLEFGDYLKKAEESACARGKGIWEGTGHFTPPRYYVAGKTGDLFHDPGCPLAMKIPADSRFRVGAREARRLGLSPCPSCLKGLAIESSRP